MKIRRLFKVILDGLGHALCKAAANGHVEVIKELKSINKFEKVPANGLFGIGHAVIMGASQPNAEVIKALRAWTQFKDIPATGEYGLRHARYIAQERSDNRTQLELICSKPLTVYISSLLLLGAIGFALSIRK